MENTDNISESELKKSERTAALKIKAEYKGLQRYSNVLRVQKKDLQQILDKSAKDVDPAPLKICIYPPTFSAETIKAAQGEDITELKPLTGDLEASKDKGGNSATKPLSSTSAVFLDDSILNSHELKQTNIFLEMPTEHSAKDQDAFDFPTIFPSTDEAESSDEASKALDYLSNLFLEMPADNSAKDKDAFDFPIIFPSTEEEASIALDYPSVLPQKVMVPPDNPSEPLQMFVSEKNLSGSEPRPDSTSTALVKQNSENLNEKQTSSKIVEKSVFEEDANMKTEDDVPLNKLGEKSPCNTLEILSKLLHMVVSDRNLSGSEPRPDGMATPRVYTEPSLENLQPDSEPEEIPLANSESGQLQSLEMTDLDVAAVQEPSVEVLKSTQGSKRKRKLKRRAQPFISQKGADATYGNLFFLVIIFILFFLVIYMFI